VNLEDEHRAAVRALTREDAEELCNTLGISYFLVAIYQMVGIAPIARKDGLGQPAPDGALAYITPLRVDRPDTVVAREPWETVRCGEIVDLIAWDPRTPQSWALRIGGTSWLGSVPLNEPFPAMIRASPLAWLQADCDGFVVLRRDPLEISSLLGQCEHGIQADNPKLVEKLHRLMTQPIITPPKITVRPPAGGGAPPDYGPGSYRRRQAAKLWGTAAGGE
jgi:hypothetical protein